MISIDQVSFGYHEDNLVLNAISLNIQSGEKLAILGPNGSGKSTLLKLIAGVYTPQQGKITITVDGVQVKRNELLKKFDSVKILNQKPLVYPRMSVRENLNYALLAYDEEFKQAQITKLVKRTGLQKLLDSKPEELSGGQLHRLSFAMAIATQPDVLLLDEPFSHLDQNYQTRLLSMASNYARDTGSILMLVTHNPLEAFVLADTLVMMHNGDILQKGEIQDLYKNPVNDFVASFFGFTHVLKGKVLNKLLETDQFEKSQSYGLRAEDIKIKKQGLKCTVSSTLFAGPYHLIKVMCNGTLLTVYDWNKKYKTGDELKLSIRMANILRFK